MYTANKYHVSDYHNIELPLNLDMLPLPCILNNRSSSRSWKWPWKLLL